MRILLFNPDTDLALAQGAVAYTPKAGVCQMISQLGLLPLWYARPGDRVLVHAPADTAFLAQLESLWGISARPALWEELAGLESCGMEPWGWNRALRNSLIRAGVLPDLLPTEEQIDTCRRLAGRDMAGKVLAHFAGQEPFCGEQRSLRSVEACRRAFGDWGGQVVFKSPHSSSGKGLLWCRGRFDDADANRCRRVIEAQGYITAAPIYPKVLDFAMEFAPDAHGRMAFAGYSLFTSDARGAYARNILLSDTRIEDVLCGYVERDVLARLRGRMAALLTAYGYGGRVGVDMMVCARDGGYRIHPCVEINYRMTMGMVARTLADRYMCPEGQGHLAVARFDRPSELRRFHRESREAHPLVLRDGRIAQGYMPLTPAGDGTQWLAYVNVSEPVPPRSHFRNGQWPSQRNTSCEPTAVW